jgi:hypothetical protein
VDIESPQHLERLRDQPEIKAALLRSWMALDAREVRFERAAKNRLYWPPIENLSRRFLDAGCAERVCDGQQIYGRPCWLLANVLAPSPNAAYVIALASADGAPLDVLQALLREVCHDYWHGSYFFK